jgi:hypothetical protein
MLLNWLAFYAAIMNPALSVDKAMTKMGISLHVTKHSRTNKEALSAIKNEDVMEMVRLRDNNVPYKEIGAIYGISVGCVYSKIRRMK